jgi:hypothetical protein
MPLPLYGSTGFKDLISEAICVTLWRLLLDINNVKPF